MQRDYLALDDDLLNRVKDLVARVVLLHVLQLARDRMVAQCPYGHVHVLEELLKNLQRHVFRFLLGEVSEGDENFNFVRLLALSMNAQDGVQQRLLTMISQSLENCSSRNTPSEVIEYLLLNCSEFLPLPERTQDDARRVSPFRSGQP